MVQNFGRQCFYNVEIHGFLAVTFAVYFRLSERAAYLLQHSSLRGSAAHVGFAAMCHCSPFSCVPEGRALLPPPEVHF